MNACSVVGIPWGGGDNGTLPYVEEFIELKGDEGMEKALCTSARTRELTGETFTTWSSFFKMKRFSSG